MTNAIKWITIKNITNGKRDKRENNEKVKERIKDS